MERIILTSNQFPKIKKLRKEYKIFRAIETKVKKNLDIVEFVNGDRIFRGFGRTTKKAFKNAVKEVSRHYSPRHQVLSA